MFIDCKNEETWLQKRHRYITASDAANYCECNPYDKDGAVNLWAEKTGLIERPFIGNKPAVIFGKEAEPILRALFLARHPEYVCQYDQFGLYVSDERPWMAATLDGLLINKTGQKINLEIKTGTARSLESLRAWQDDGVPLNYYCQTLHQMYCVPELIGTWVFGFIMLPTSEQYEKAQHFVFETYLDKNNPEIQKDTSWLLDKADYMHECIVNRKRPEKE